MSSTFATTPVGRAINTLSQGRLLQTPDQRPGWEIPASLKAKMAAGNGGGGISSTSTIVPGGDEEKMAASTSSSATATTVRPSLDGGEQQKEELDVDKMQGMDVEAQFRQIVGSKNDGTAAATILPNGQDLLKSECITRAPTIPTAKPSSDVIIVDWYGPNDPENPQNFTLTKKLIVTLAICFLTFSVYGGSSIVTPGTLGVMQEFNVSQIKGIMTLSVFVMGYAVGPLLLGPPSDIPKIGRSTPYWASMLALVLFNVGAAQAQSYGTLIVCRFFAGMMGSPALATGGATLGDVWGTVALPKAIAVWSIGAVCGPVLAPVMAGWAAQNVSWRLPYWLFVALSGVGLLVTLFMLPETLPANILYRRAKRLRQLTGNDRLRSQGEVDQSALKPLPYVMDALWMPIRISMEPIVLYSSVLLGLVYAIFYAAFEAVPIIFGEIHHFNLGQQQLPFLGLGVNAFFFTLPLYLFYMVYYFDPRFERNLAKGIVKAEDRIILALLTAPLVLISLFWTGWTAKESISYWSPLIALSLYLTPVFLLFQSVLVYLSFSYIEHQASVLAANDLIRSLIAASFPLFAPAMFKTLGLGRAYSMLAGISAALLIPLFGLYMYGHKLRKMSKYAHDYDTDIPAFLQSQK